MFNRLWQWCLVVSLVLLPVFPVYAQDGDGPELTGTYTFENGVSFSYPANWSMDEYVTSTDFMVTLSMEDDVGTLVQVYELGTLFGEMELDLAYVEDMYGSSTAEAWGYDYSTDDYETIVVDGHELYVLALVDGPVDAPSAAHVIVVPYSDGSSFGLLIAFSVSDSPPASYEQDILAMAASMDVESSGSAGGGASLGGLSGAGLGAANDTDTGSEAIDVSAVELATTHTFNNGVSFGYPANWDLHDFIAPTDDMVTLIHLDTSTLLQVYDLNTLFGGMPLDLIFVQEMYGDISAGAWNFEYSLDDYQTVIVNDRELSMLPFEGEQDGSPVIGYVVVVPYSDDAGFGLLMAFTVTEETPPNYEQDVLAMAASMDVAGR